MCRAAFPRDRACPDRARKPHRNPQTPFRTRLTQRKRCHGLSARESRRLSTDLYRGIFVDSRRSRQTAVSFLRRVGRPAERHPRPKQQGSRISTWHSGVAEGQPGHGRRAADHRRFVSAAGTTTAATGRLGGHKAPAGGSRDSGKDESKRVGQLPLAALD